MPKSDTHIGERIKRHRERAGLTQQQLATKAGISLSNLSQIEQGQKEDPRISTVQAIAAALGMGLDALVSDSGERAAPAGQPSAERTSAPSRGKGATGKGRKRR
jgi:transcriptional regulator with XRE-family HTH domain